MTYPKISCICPTRGRYDTLRESISFFILQDYPNKELIIFNNHPEPLIAHPKLIKHNIKVINAGDYSGLSMQKIYNDALKYVSEDSEYISIWDDDDMYFPWHISDNMEKLLLSNKLAIRPAGGYWQDIHNSTGIEYSIIKNNLEAGMIAKKELVFFDSNISDSKSEHYTHPHILWCSQADKNNQFIFNKEITAIYRWGYGKSYAHLQSVGPHKNNSDTGVGALLKPKSISSLFFDFLHKCHSMLCGSKICNFDDKNKSGFLSRLLKNNIYMYDHIDKYKVWLYWNDENKIPTFIKECFKSITDNTFAECVILNDSSLMAHNPPSYVANLNPVEKSEFIRVYFLNRYGGWWFDADTFVVGDLDKYYFQYLSKNESYFPSEYNVPGKITTPLLCSRPNGLIIRSAWLKINDFLSKLTPPYNLGWAKLNFVGILSSVDEYSYALGHHLITANDLVKWNYNNDKIKEWKFDTCDTNKIQIYLLHWSQIGAEVSWKIKDNPTLDDIAKTYPNLGILFNLSNKTYGE
jgi:hypothetical protein